MKYKKSWLAAFVLFSMLSMAACGKFQSGTATLSESLTANPYGGIATNSTCTVTQANMTFYSSNGRIQGDESGSCYSEHLTGTDAGNGQITGVVLTMYPSSQMNPYTTYGTTQATCTYTGTLNYGNNVISGFLQLQAAATPTPTVSGVPSYTTSYCSPTVSLQGGITQ